MADGEPIPDPDLGPGKPWWQHTAFRALILGLWGLWLPFLHEWLTRLMAEPKAVAFETSLTLTGGFVWTVIITKQSEAHGAALQRYSQE